MLSSRDVMAAILRWRRRYLSYNQFLIIISFFVGVFIALAALLLKWMIGRIGYLLTHQFHPEHANWLFLVYPVVGIYLTMLFIRYVVRDDISHGVTKILFAIARKQSMIRRHNIWSSVVAFQASR